MNFGNQDLGFQNLTISIYVNLSPFQAKTFQFQSPLPQHAEAGAFRESVVGIIYVHSSTTLTTRSIIPSSRKRDRPPRTVQGLDYSYSQTVSIRFKWLLPSPELAHSVAADIVVQHNVHHFISMVSALF